MALSKVVNETALVIEVENGVDASGDVKYSKKTFGGIKNDAPIQNIYDVALAIKNILAATAGETLINVSSSIVNA